MSNEKKVWGLSIVSALFCPCCALPAMLSILGSTGVAVQFEWLATLRPFFMLIALGSLIYLWRSYYIHHRQHAKAECCDPAKPNPYHNKYFLIGLTVFICSMTLVPALL